MPAGLVLALKAGDGGLAFHAPLLDPLAVQLIALEALLGRHDVVLPAGRPFQHGAPRSILGRVAAHGRNKHPLRRHARVAPLVRVAATLRHDRDGVGFAPN